jgi:predicted DNA-binding transcriptional regulator YafY
MGNKDSSSDIYKLLAEYPKGLSAKEIADRLGMARTSVYVPLDKLKKLGKIVQAEDGRFRLPNKDRDFSSYQLTLSKQQAHDLAVAVESVKVLTPHAQQALEQLQSTLHRQNITRQPAVFCHSYDEIDPLIYERIVVAIDSGHTLFIRYDPSATTPSEHTFEPYRILFWNGHYYLVGVSTKYRHKPSGGKMHLRLDRMIAVRDALDENGYSALTFAQPVDFDPQAYIEQYFGTFGGDGEQEEVILRFPADVAKAAADVKRHPSRVLHWQDDSSLHYHMTIAISQEVARWVASWAGVRVLAPDHLRQQVREHCQALAKANEDEEAPALGEG